MANRKMTNVKTIMYKILHRKLNIEQQDPLKLEWYAVSAPLVAPVVLLLLKPR